MNSDLQCKKLTATGYVFEGPGRVITVFAHTALSGSFQLRDGGPGGEILIDISLPNNATTVIPLGGSGVRFRTSIYLSATNIDAITVCWG